MNIIPKIADVDVENIENIQHFITDTTDKIEIQMLSEELLKSLSKCIKIIEHSDGLNYIVLHLPFNMMNICYIHSNYEIEKKFLLFVVEVIKYSLRTNKKIDILFHISMRCDEFVSIGGINFLTYLCSMVENTNVGFLLENSIISLNLDDNDTMTECKIFKIIDEKKLNFCLDLCHWQASENVMGKKLKLEPEVLRKLKNCHFSMTLDNDGYKNKRKTHGRGHKSFELCLKDLEYLKKKGVNLEEVNLITEINEIDYKKRPEMNKELGFLWDIKKKDEGV